jgi:membrane-associated phospholipid phosphatase
MTGNTSLLKNSKILRGMVLLSVMAVFYAFFSSLDKEIASWFKSISGGTSMLHVMLDSAAPVVALISNGVTLMSFSVLFCLIGKFTNERVYESGQLLILGFLSSGIIVQILKHIAGRARPRLTFENVFAGPSLRDAYHSFPSGHTSVAFCLAYILSHYFPRYRWAFYLMALVMGLQRVAGLAHFSSDVIAGALIGIVVARLLTTYMSGYTLKQKALLLYKTTES